MFLGKTNYNWLRASDRGVLSKKPVFVPDDLKGMKMRMFQAEAPIKAWAALGANVQVIPWPDVYTALVTGTVDISPPPLRFRPSAGYGAAGRIARVLSRV